MEDYKELIIGIITAIIGVGAFITIKKISKSKSKNYKIKQENIEISGDGSKVVGGDDNSKP